MLRASVLHSSLQRSSGAINGCIARQALSAGPVLDAADADA